MAALVAAAKRSPDLHDDVESPPGFEGRGARSETSEPGAMAANVIPADAPDGLAELVASWNELPTNVRSAIAALASS